MPFFNRVAAGLILREPFISGNAWTLGTNFSIIADPTLIASERSALMGLAPAAIGGIDGSGIRELSFTSDVHGHWWLFYDAADGSGAPWVGQCAGSADRGLSWTKHGSTSFGLAKHNNPTDGFGVWLARGISLEVVDGADNWWMQTIDAPHATGAGNPGPPYISTLYKITGGPPIGTWAWQQTDTAPRAPDFFNDVDSYAYSSVQVAGANYLFIGGTSSGSSPGYYIGVASGTSFDGPWASARVLNAGALNQGSPENPRVIWHPGLNRWIIFNNQILWSNVPRNYNNQIFISPGTDITTWAGFGRKLTQYSSTPADGSDTIGTGSPLFTINGNALLSPNQFVGFVYSTDPNMAYNNDVQHHARYCVMEPSPSSLRYFSVDSIVHQATCAIVHSNTFSAQFVVEFVSTTGGIAFDYLVQAGGDSYRIVCSCASGLVLQKSVGGVYTAIATSADTLKFHGPTAELGKGPEPGPQHRVRLKIANGVHTIFLDGQNQISVSDATYTAGISIRFVGSSAVDVRMRHLHMRTGDTLSIRGVPKNAATTVRSAQMPFATATASPAGVVAYTLGHWPLETLEVNGSDVAPFDNVLYGGDSLVMYPGRIPPKLLRRRARSYAH